MRAPLALRQIPLLLCCLVFWQAASAEDFTEHLRTARNDLYRITYWNSEQGLPQNTVNALHQDRQGYLWIGTRYGLARFDGVRFTDFTAQLSAINPALLDVRGLAEDKNGHLWIQTEAGFVSFHEGRFELFPHTNSPFKGLIVRILPSESGGLWVARFDGIYHWNKGKSDVRYALASELKSIDVFSAQISNMISDEQGGLWVKSFAGPYDDRWCRIDPRSGQVGPIPGLDAVITNRAICLDTNGVLWSAGPGELASWDNGVPQRVEGQVPWGNNLVKTIQKDPWGNLWVNSEGAVQVHRFSHGKFTSFGRGQGLQGADDVRCLLPDREGNMWVGTGLAGFSRMQPRQMLSLLTGSLSTMDEVYSVAPGKEGRVWLATTYGLVRYQNGAFAVFTNTAGFGNDNLKRLRVAFEHSSSEVLFALDFDGLFTLKGTEFAPVPGVKPVYNQRRLINSMAEDAEGTLWMATARGLVARRGNDFTTWSREQGFPDERAFGLAIGTNGSVWVGSYNAGVSEFREGRFRTYSTAEGLLSQNAWPLRVEPDGAVWVGTPVGLNRIRDGQVRSVTMRDGLYDNLAYCLLEDGRGNLWTFGNRGIWRMKKDQLNAIADGTARWVHCINYGEADGMPSAEGNGDQQPNAAILPNGELWFPTTRGVVVFDPAELPEPKGRPPVIIEQVTVDSEVIYADGGLIGNGSKYKQASGELRLPPGRARVVEVMYTATSFTFPEKTRFRTRLLGHAEEWHEMDTRRVAVFTNLRPGSHSFEVEACNHFGNWSDRPARFSFELAPQFYQTWPFLACCVLTTAAVLGTWHFRRLGMRKRWQRLQRDRAIEGERNRIARDLHDDLGANLTGLAMQIDIALHQLNRPEQLRPHLMSLSQAARNLVDVMREVIWSINPHCDTLESFTSYTCQFSEKILRPVGLGCRFDLPATLPDITLTSEIRHHLLLVIKEALNNTAKHASASEVTIALRLELPGLVLEISDNGTGCSPAQLQRLADPEQEADNPIPAVGTGNGLRNMRQRVQVLGGTVQFESASGRGFTIRVRVPLPPPN